MSLNDFPCVRAGLWQAKRRIRVSWLWSALPPCPQRLPETEMPGHHQGHHVDSLKKQIRQKGHHFLQNSFHSTVNQTLASNYILTTLDTTLLWASPASSVLSPCCSLFTHSPQLCTTLLRSLAGTPQDTEHSDVFNNTSSIKNYHDVNWHQYDYEDKLYNRT